ncbi:MAG TPA: glucose 1-dehydrogenase [Steroidobacteraceae bacterium]|jgi:3-oxoacyl-[acyl-carrier protein] reductase|nr:glucose 1-dehydrogenase [Steroidobacteraceae bacterium]
MTRIDDLHGKAVLITGASTGIGATLARAFAAQGAKLALHYNSHEADARTLAAELGTQPALVRGDLTKRGEARRVVDDAAAALGGLDVLINNAGGIGERRPITEVDDALFDFVYDLNVRSLLAATQAAIPHFEKRGGGNIVNVGSIAGIDGGGAGASVYSSAKAAVHNLTRHTARDLAKKNIRVNTVAPGAIATPFHAKTPKERLDAMRNAAPMGRIGEPQDCVGAFLFLASNELSGYITGNIVHVNGGMFMP